MSKAKRYPNRDALRQANDIYLDAIYPFVSKCLDKFQDTTAEELIRDALSLASHDNIEKKIEISDIAHLVRTYWYDYFQDRFEAIDPHYEARSAIGLIVEGRNRASHRPWDLDPEFTRTQLFLIAEVLGKINRPDAQDEVEAIQKKLFDDTTEQLVTTAVEAKEAEYEKSIAEVEKRLAAEEESNKELLKQINGKAAELDKKTEKLNELSEQLFAAKDTKKQFDSKSKELKKVQAAYDTCKERLTSTETERDDYKEALETASNELKEAEAEWQACENSLAAVRKLFTIATIGNQTVQVVYPPIETDATVRILDRRGIDKRNFLLDLLEQKQPTVIYVQSEEMVDLLLERIVPEKADLIEKHSEQTAEAEEKEILEKLENGELIAVVSDATFSTLASSHCIEHFVLCHLAPGVDEFYKRCEPAFTSRKNAYLHLIYNSEQDIERIAQKYPDRKALEKLYPELRKLAETNGDFLRLEIVYNELDLAKPAIETGLAIFEELQLLERNDEGVKLLPPAGKKLDESRIYCRGEELKKRTADFRDFQLECSVEKIWEEILAKLDMNSEQILREDSIDEVYPSVSEIESDQQPMETVENDSEEGPEVKQSEFWQPIRAGEFGTLFAGKPVPVSNEGWISKSIRNIGVCLYLNNHRCYVQIYFHGANGSERREKVMTLFPKSEYAYVYRDSSKETKVQFPVLDKGRKDQDDWDEIREKLVAMGTDIYNKIDESDL